MYERYHFFGPPCIYLSASLYCYRDSVNEVSLSIKLIYYDDDDDDELDICKLSNGTITTGYIEWPWRSPSLFEILPYLGEYIIVCMICGIFTLSRKAHMACNFNFLFENEGLLEVATGHVLCKCGNISEYLTHLWAITNQTVYWLCLFLYQFLRNAVRKNWWRRARRTEQNSGIYPVPG